MGDVTSTTTPTTAPTVAPVASSPPATSASSSQTINTTTSIAPSSSTSSATTSTAVLSTTLVPFTTTLASVYTSGYTWQDTVFLTYTEAYSTHIGPLSFSTVLSGSLTSGQVWTGQATATLEAARTPSNSTGNSTNTASNPAISNGEKSSGSSGLSGGAVAGVAIGALLVGALIAGLVFFALYKRNQRRQRQKHVIGAGGLSNAHRYDEKSGATAVAVGQDDSFDLDRLLPQPLDDSRVKGEVETLFTQIDGHVENFYSDARLSSKTQLSAEQAGNRMLVEPTTRLFAIKKLICQAMVEAISPNCPTDRSLLPFRFGAIAAQLSEPNIDNHANALSWSRLRSSMGYLLKSEPNPAERQRVDQAVNTTVSHLNAQVQPFEFAGSSRDRAADLDAICRTSVNLGGLLLSQPAAWKFDWHAGSSASAGSRNQFVYFPALIRLTDNKARKLRSPFVALPAKTAAL